MTTQQAKTLLPLIQALAEGKTIQVCSINDNTWENTTNPHWANDFNYRIKPEPKLRPFTIDEIKLGWWIKLKKKSPTKHLKVEEFEALILFKNITNKYVNIYGSFHYLQDLFDNFLYSKDQGVTWLPCGVEQ